MRLITRRPAYEDAGFLLLETVIALSLLAFVAVAVSAAFISNINATNRLEHKQVAALVTAEGLEAAKAVSAQFDIKGCSPLLQGRPQNLVQAQWAQAPSQGITPPPVSPVWAEAGCPGTAASVPLFGLAQEAGLVPQQPVIRDNISYWITTFIGLCKVESDGNCVSTGASDDPLKSSFHVTVAVRWDDRSCTGGKCVYQASTIIDAAPDPVFNVRNAPAPVAQDDTICVPKRQPTIINIIANDTGSLGNAPVKIIRPPSKGQLGNISTGTGTYTSHSAADDSFTYQLVDVNGTLSAPATVTLKVKQC